MSLCIFLPVNRGLASCRLARKEVTLEQNSCSQEPPIQCGLPCRVAAANVLATASGELEPFPSAWPREAEGRLGLCSLEGRAGGSASALRCPGAHSLVGGSGAASVGPPQPEALPVWTAVMEKAVIQPLHIMAFLFGPLSWQGQAIGFITAASCLLDAPMVTNQIFPWSRWLQSLQIIFTYNVTFNHTQCIVC